MAGKRSRYIDPATGSYVIEDGNYRKISAAASWAYVQIMTLRESAAGLPTHGSNLRNIRHMRVGVTRDIIRAIDEVMQPEVGTRFKAYTRTCVIKNGAPLFTVTITSNDGTVGSFSVPWSQ